TWFQLREYLVREINGGHQAQQVNGGLEGTVERKIHPPGGESDHLKREKDLARFTKPSPQTRRIRSHIQLQTESNAGVSLSKGHPNPVDRPPSLEAVAPVNSTAWLRLVNPA